MSDLEVAYNSDQEVSKNHSNLIQAVARLDKKQRVNKAERSEPTLEVSEFHLVKSAITNKDAVQIRDLVKSLGQKGYQSQITKRLKSVKKSKPLSKPLEKPSAEKVKKRFGFERTLKDLSRWNAVVARNRTATHLSFPLRTPKQKLKIDSPADFINNLRLKSDLQQKLEELDPKPKEPSSEEKDEKKRKDKEDKSQMTLNEMKEKRHETAKHRARQSYQEAKAQRQRKIKSKKFHRIERKKKNKEQLLEFEKLQKTDPEKALILLEQLDKSRAEERMSLRHKSTGQWAKNKQIRAKYNKETRQVLANQLSIGRDLTQKVRLVSDDDENKASSEFANIVEKPCNDNKMMSEVNEFIQSFRKYCDKKKTDKLDKKKEEESKEETVPKVDSESESSVNKLDTSNDMLEKQISDEPYKTNDTIVSAVVSLSKKIKESTKVKKANKKANTSCNVISDEIVSKKKKAKLCDKKNKTKENNKHNTGVTSTWHVEEIQCNKKVDSKTSKIVDVDDMFDSVEENMKRKVNLKIQRIKKKLEMENKENKRKKKEKKKSENYMPDLEFKDSKQKPILDLPLEETDSRGNSRQNTDLMTMKTIMNTEQEPTITSNNHAEEINVQNPRSMNTKSKHIKTQIPDLDVDEEDVLDNDEQETDFDKFMNEVMENSDAEEEFRKEKEEEIKNSQPENINTSLPGWGSWAGTNIKESKVKRKNKRFIIKFPKNVPRKDENKGDVIIFEGENQKLKEHLVSELPYPFTTVKDFEASIRAPLGRTFVPENAHRRLIEPSIVTKSGQVIEPMTEEMLLEKKQPSVKRRIDKQKKDSMKNNKKKRKQDIMV